jgi:hypothetical protein
MGKMRLRNASDADLLALTAGDEGRLFASLLAVSRAEGVMIESGGGSCCYTAADTEAGGAFNEGGESPLLTGKSQTQLIMLVPDGVARVSFRWHSPRLSVTVRVHDNFAAVRIYRACCNGIEHTIWYAADGRVIPQRRAPARP